MKPEELRIGNYFQWSEFASMGKGIGQITHGQQIMDYIDLKEGATVTEEWLLKFGFEKERGAYEKGHDLWIALDWLGQKRSEPTVWIRGNHCPSIKIRYVHQLQNLYYALTGKELTIK